MVIYDVNEKEEAQIERKRLGISLEIEGRSPLEPMADKQVHILCTDHGPFPMSWENHIGDNKEKIAYDCPKCDADEVLLDVSLSRKGYRKLKTSAESFRATANERIQQLINDDYRENGGSYEEHLSNRLEQGEKE